MQAALLPVLVTLSALGTTLALDEEKKGAVMNKTQLKDACESELFPCSDYIGGNLILIAYYGLTLGFSAKMISDGSEMLLDLGVAPALIGGVILPVSGAVPDSMMIFVSGLGTKAAAQDQISVGMGTLAGSTILLLTLAWAISLYVGRVDLVAAPTCHGLVANEQSKCTGVHLMKQGVEISREVTISAFIMLVTMIPYFVIQSADWYFGATLIKVKEPGYVRAAALITFILSMTGFVLYLGMQFKMAKEGANARMAKREKEREQEMLLKAAKFFYMSNMMKASGGVGMNPFASNISSKLQSKGKSVAFNGTYTRIRNEEDPNRERMLERKYFAAWKLSVQMKKNRRSGGSEMELKSTESEDAIKETTGEKIEEPKWKILAKSLTLLTTGITLVTIFSDPMCDTLSRITDRKNPQFIPLSSFYISFIVTPLCSNASELVSSITFAMKKEKDNLILTYTQLYSAAIMNNTLCLGVFCGLVFFRDLEWYFSAEVTAILIVEAIMGFVAIRFRKMYYLALAIPVAILYILSFGIVWFLENVMHWG